MSIQQFKPDRSLLLQLLNDKTLKWIMQEVKKKHPKWPASKPPKSLEDAYTKAGEQSVIEYIYQLLGVEDEV